jgi:hypothetical protein
VIWRGDNAWANLPASGKSSMILGDIKHGTQHQRVGMKLAKHMLKIVSNDEKTNTLSIVLF